MSQELHELANTALDNFQAISRLQELLEISMEQLDQPTKNSYLRLELLLDSYQASMTLYLDELRTSLECIRGYARELVNQTNQVPETSSPEKLPKA